MFLKRNPLSFQKNYGCCMKSSNSLFQNLKGINQTYIQKHQQKKLKHSTSGHQKSAQRNSQSANVKKTLKRSLEYGERHADSCRNSNANEKKNPLFVLCSKGQPFQEKHIGQIIRYPCPQRKHYQQIGEISEKNRYSNITKSVTQNHSNQQKAPFRNRRTTSIAQVIMNQDLQSSSQINDDFNYNQNALGGHRLTAGAKDRSKKEMLISSGQCTKQKNQRIGFNQNNQSIIRQHNNSNFNQKNNVQTRFSCKQSNNQPVYAKFQHTIYLNPYTPKMVYQQVPKITKPINIANVNQKSLRLSVEKQVTERQFVSLKENQKLSLKSGQLVRGRENSITRSCQSQIQAKQVISNTNITEKNQPQPQYNPNIKFSAAVSTEVDMVNSDRNVFQSMILIKKTNQKYQQSNRDTCCPTQRRRNNFLNRKMTVQSINDNSDMSSDESIVVQQRHSDQNMKLEGFLALNKTRSIFS